MVLVSNHCRSFFLLFFILTSRAYVSASTFTFPQSFSCSSQVSDPLCLASASPVEVHWSIEQPPASFTLFLVEDTNLGQGTITIAQESVKPNKETSGDVIFNNLQLQLGGTYRVTAGTPSNPQIIGSSSKVQIVASSPNGTAAQGSGSLTSTSVSHTTSSSPTGEATTIATTTSTSEQTQSGTNGGSGPVTNTDSLTESGAPSETASGQTDSSSIAIPKNNSNASSSSSLPAAHGFPSETDAPHTAPTNAVPSDSPSPVAASSNNGGPSKVGMIIGAVLGAIVFLGLLTCMGVVLLKRRNRKRAEQLLIKDMLTAAPYSQRSSVMTQVVDDEELERQLLEWKYGPGGLAEETEVRRRLQEWKYGGASRCETPHSSA